ncbi:MAG TPA: CpsB/CapC family capsule biosynthesis tyrosine phosphatase [Edaphocola sp.]|nr:CpsB/CapC family capsule biosynthesis tyrosine phosphatase [Edaphocola sp.]
MFSIFKKKERFKINYKDFFTQDMHSHLLPGIDDGSPNIQTSIELILGMKNIGFQNFIGTPHIMADMHKNNRETITKAHNELKEALQKNNLDIDIKFAAEYMLDEGFIHHIEKGNLLTVFKNYILIETPFYIEPMELENLLFEIESKGYKGILAHPERYHYVDDDLKVFEKYIYRDFPLQLNILSLSGYYGTREKEIAKKMLDAGMYSLIGSDLHHERHLKRLESMVLSKKMIEKLEKTEWLNSKITS